MTAWQCPERAECGARGQRTRAKACQAFSAGCGARHGACDPIGQGGRWRVAAAAGPTRTPDQRTTVGDFVGACEPGTGNARMDRHRHVATQRRTMTTAGSTSAGQQPKLLGLPPQSRRRLPADAERVRERPRPRGPLAAMAPSRSIIRLEGLRPPAAPESACSACSTASARADCSSAFSRKETASCAAAGSEQACRDRRTRAAISRKTRRSRGCRADGSRRSVRTWFTAGARAGEADRTASPASGRCARTHADAPPARPGKAAARRVRARPGVQTSSCDSARID